MEGIVISLVVTVLAFLIGFILAPYIREKGLFNNKSLALTNQLLDMSQIIIKNTNMKDKDVSLTVLEVASIAVQYIEQTAGFERRNEVKKELAIKTVIKTLNSMKIEITDDIEELIELGIESAVSRLPKTNK